MINMFFRRIRNALGVATRHLRARWKRNAAIVLLILVPMSTFLSTFPLSQVASSNLQFYTKFVSGYVVISAGPSTVSSTPYISKENISKIEGLSEVSSVFGIMVTWDAQIPLDLNYCLKNRPTNLPVNMSEIRNCTLAMEILGFDTSLFNKIALPFELVQGRFPNNSSTQDIAINDFTAKDVNLTVGSKLRIQVHTNNPNSSSTYVNLNVVGIFNAFPLFDIFGFGPEQLQAPTYLGVLGIMDQHAFEAIFPNSTGRYSQAWVIVKDPSELQKAKDEISAMFPNFVVYAPTSLGKTTISVLGSSQTILDIISYLSLAALGFVISFAYLYDQQSRLREFCLYFTFGWNSKDVLKFELGLSLIRLVPSILIAAALSSLLENYFLNALRLGEIISTAIPAYLYATSLLLTLIISCLFSFLAVYFGTKRIATKMPAELIR